MVGKHKQHNYKFIKPARNAHNNTLQLNVSPHIYALKSFKNKLYFYYSAHAQEALNLNVCRRSYRVL